MEGCFNFLRRNARPKEKRKATRSTVPVMSTSEDHDVEKGPCPMEGRDESPQHSKRDTLDTFAPCRKQKEKLVMMPYFGNFAGQWLTFDLKRSDSLTSVRVKVEGSEQSLTTLYHRDARPSRTRNEHAKVACSLRDRCLKYAHEAGQNFHRRSPSSLTFLCEQTVLLHLDELPVSQLPTHRYEGLFQARTQEVTIRVWPRRFCDSLRMRVKPNMSVMELKWMLCLRLSLPNPTCLNMYQKDSLENLPPNSPLQPHHLELECVISHKVLQKGVRWEEGRKSLPVTVSVIGQGIGDVKVHPNMTLREFEQAIKKTFGLGNTSFLYMPQVFQSRKSSQCGLTMATVLDDTTASLITTDHRNFPIVIGMPSLKIEDSYKQLPLYQMTISELDLLKASPLIAFEVSGPTIPLAFKTIRAQGFTEDLSYFNPRDSVFALVSVKPHVVSVNPDWTLATLLKFIECISGFPCEFVKIGKRLLENSDTVAAQLVKRWLSSRHGHLEVRDDIPIPEVVATL